MEITHPIYGMINRFTNIRITIEISGILGLNYHTKKV